MKAVVAARASTMEVDIYPHHKSVGHALPETRNFLAYRPEVDGLRTVAVLPVILFHGGFPLFSGGFVGVDVFFVISGYLITCIILADLRSERFTIAGFYERRARRILPALFFVMLACLPLAWVWMMPAQLIGLGQSLMAVSVFVSNIFFWRTSGYFEPAAEEKPLLHTWSLSVEEQFYVFFPLLVALLWKRADRRLAWIVLGLAVISFSMSEWAWRHGKSLSSFFLIPTRAWELLLGALVALTATPAFARSIGATAREIGSASGLLLILVSIFAYGPQTPFPSVYALLPTVGAALVLTFGQTGTLSARLLSQPAMVGIGLISYSAYLWHQPLFAFARVYGVEGSSQAVFAALTLGALLLAYVTWRFVESPFRNRQRFTRRAIVWASLGGTLFFFGVGATLHLCGGFEERIPEHLRFWIPYSDNSRSGAYVKRRFVDLQGSFGHDARPKLLVIGDSFAQDFTNSAFEQRALEGWTVRTFAIDSRCQIYLDAESAQQHWAPAARSLCAQAKTLATAADVIAQADVVVLAASWLPWAAELLPRTIASLHLRPSQRLFVIGRKDFGSINVRHLMSVPLTQLAGARNAVSPSHLRVNDIMQRTLSADVFVDVHALLCDRLATCPLFTPEGKLISFDGAHLTPDGAGYVGRLLFHRSALRDLVSPDIYVPRLE